MKKVIPSVVKREELFRWLKYDCTGESGRVVGERTRVELRPSLVDFYAARGDI